MNARGRLGVLVLVSTACASAHPTPPAPQAKVPDYPMTLSAPSSHPGNFSRRQKIVARYQGQTHGSEGVLQKKGDQLVIVGLTPFGTKAFVLIQDGTDVRVTGSLAQALPFPPTYVLNDVTRTYFDGVGNGSLPDGKHAVERHGERISERWKDGRLMERRFTRLAQDPPGEISITYVGGMAGERSPTLIEFDNGWIGYHLSITTLSEESLE